MSKVWFITGASRGFGRIWAQAALERGDSVALTARRPDDIADLVDQYGDRALGLTLDVTRRDDVFAAAESVVERFGRIDVCIVNAGYGQFGMIEEITEDEARAQLDANVMGALFTMQSVLPTMRAQGSGHILTVSSLGGVRTNPGLGIYHASKWALEAMSSSLAQETAAMGIHVTIIEPAGFTTDWGGASSKRAEPNPAYDQVRQTGWPREVDVPHGGDPQATGEVVLELVDMAEPPLRILFGANTVPVIEDEYAQRLATWRSHQDLSEKSHGQPS